MVVRIAMNRNAKTRKEALAEAESKLTLKGHPGRKAGDLASVRLKANEIGAIPELFQPREFTFGMRDTDPIHIKALEQEIRIHGQLHPPLVIKLKRTGWVVAEGHHRIEAYKAAGKGDQEIECEWFYGTVREVADAALKRNNVVKLNIKQPDRMEEAWKRVLMGWGSKQQIVRLCGVGEGTVAAMRRAVRLVQLQDLEHKDFGEAEAFRERLSTWGAAPLKENATSAEALAHLETVSWGIVGRVYRGVTEKEFDADTAAMWLAREIQNRLEHKLARDPEITARALKLYDPSLPPQLMKAWRKSGDDDDYDPYLETEEDDASPDVPL
jgi:ParB-like nuclease domain